MRTEENWENTAHRYLLKFPPRVQDDLCVLKKHKAQQLLKKYGATSSFFIHGAVRTDKTVLAAQMMMEELKRIYLLELQGVHNTTYFISFPEMLHQIKRAFSTQEDVIGKYLGAHMLVLDDFITTRPTDWVMDTLYYLVNHRYENKRQTIITCNYSLQELEGVLQDQRIPSRISRGYVPIHKKPF